MDYNNYTGTDVEYETKEEKKKFQLTRGKLILIILVAILIISLIIFIVIKSSKNNGSDYSESDFLRLEARMIEEAPIYLSQKQVELSTKEYRIDLKDLLYENGGFIDSTKVKAAKICDGYVIAVKNDVESYLPYISCGNYYTTTGYISNDKPSKSTTTTKASSDKTNPVILLVGQKEITINVGDAYKEPGYTATDNMDGDITSSVNVTGTVDTSKPGEYKLVYTVLDSSKNKYETSRIIRVVGTVTTKPTTTTTRPVTTTTNRTTQRKTTTKVNTTKPVITTAKVSTPPTISLSGARVIYLNIGQNYSEPGYRAYDARGNNITSKVNITNNINKNNAGTYYVIYSVTDSFGNKTNTTRTVIVKSNYITLKGISLTPNSIELKQKECVTILVNYSPSNASDKTLSWSSENPSVATVFNGKVCAKNKGRTTITVKGADGVTKSSIVIVK